jgi:aminoglycoside phosphotransferase (APT) family kinase protein
VPTGRRRLLRVSIPPAEGARVAWHSVPGPVRAAIERVCGAPVTESLDQPGGFSPGTATRVRCADGTRWFVKAASADVNADSPALHRQEASLLAALDPLIAARRLPAPRLRGTAESGAWFALVAEDMAGRQPALPWQDAELSAVLAALDELATALTPAPVAAPAIAQYLESDFHGWRTLARAPADNRIDPWSRARLPELAALEATWAAHAAGDTLLHGDIRADNLLLTPDGVAVVDWPHACRGAAFADLVLFAPSVAMQGGPEPAALLARSRAGQGASREAVTAVVCALAGFFTESALRPAPPGLPTLRRFQAAQGEVARRWLATLL